jgi:hypothetical protein
MNTLMSEHNGPLLRLLVDIMIDQNVNFGITYPEDLADHIVGLAEERASSTPPAMDTYLHKELCAAYHFRGIQKSCHRVQNDRNECKTEGLIKGFYA